MELDRFVIEDGVCVVNKIIPLMKTGSILLKDKIMKEGLNILYESIGIKKGNLKSDIIFESTESELKKELLSLVKKIHAMDSKLLSFDKKTIKIMKEVDPKISIYTDRLLSIQKILQGSKNYREIYYYYPSIEICNLLKDVFHGKLSTPDETSEFIQNMDIEVEEYIVKCENIKKFIIDKYIVILDKLDELIMENYLEDYICQKEMERVRYDLDNFYKYLEELNLVELGESLVHNQDMFKNIIFILIGEVDKQTILSSKSQILIDVYEKMQSKENILDILIQYISYFKNENNKAVDNVDKLIVQRIINNGELSENFLHFNKCIKKNLSKIFEYNLKIIDKWNTCGNIDCNKPAKRECTGCHNIRYCSRICQKEHWNKKNPGSFVKHDHKSDCKGKHLEIEYNKKEFENAKKTNNELNKLNEEGFFDIIYKDDNCNIDVNLLNINYNKDKLKLSLDSLFDSI